ncbi:MAG: EF-P lysine aminoacylase GenX, partial [Pirellulaceae bacterium]|nr:EF-P lysine aminoacylase GenX [Pirellulaceae bacterium]
MKPNIQFLAERAALLRELRAFFDARQFVEVQPPCLSRDCVVDPYIDPLQIQSDQFNLPAHRLPDRFFLQTSPESAMKRMLAAGSPSIYSLGPVFRAGELGAMHNVEFTMLEWYDVGADMKSAVALLGDLAAQILSKPGCDVTTYRELFQQHVSLDPIESSVDDLIDRVGHLDAALTRSLGQDRDSMLDVLMSEVIQPHLGWQQPVIVTDYPLSQAALAKASATDPQCAARFELFASGVELANGYDELLDANVLVERAKTANQKRIASGRSPLPAETLLVTAMRGDATQDSL